MQLKNSRFHWSENAERAIEEIRIELSDEVALFFATVEGRYFKAHIRKTKAKLLCHVFFIKSKKGTKKIPNPEH